MACLAKPWPPKFLTGKKCHFLNNKNHPKQHGLPASLRSPNRFHSTSFHGFFKLQSSSLLVKKDTNLPTIIASKCQFRHLFLEAPSFIPPPSQALPNALLRISRPWLRKKSPPLRRAWWPYVMRPWSWWKLHRRWPSWSCFLRKMFGIQNLWTPKFFDVFNLLKGIHKTRSHLFLSFLCSQVV